MGAIANSCFITNADHPEIIKNNMNSDVTRSTLNIGTQTSK